jgi:hypothetical protein
MEMLTKMDVQIIINECRHTGARGLGNGSRATIQELTVDFLTPPTDFLGVGGNPAIFVNDDTYTLLGRHHKTWRINKTIAVKEHFLANKPMMVLGIIIHETGHAFNVAAKITNSEANAYIFEIEVISIWFKTKHALLLDFTSADLQEFFELRLPYYRKEIKRSDYLARLVMAIEANQILEGAFDLLTPDETLQKSSPHRFVISTPKFSESNPISFFSKAPSDSIKMDSTKKINAYQNSKPHSTML